MTDPNDVSSEPIVRVTAVTGGGIPEGSAPQALTYNADGTLNTIAYTSGGATYTQTMSYTGGLLTGISAWVKS